MKIFFSWKISITGLVLAAGMLTASVWQWNRHNEKLRYVSLLNERLNLPISELASFAASTNTNWPDLIHRRVHVKGTFDFNSEVVLRNRRFKGIPGVHVITPLQLENTDVHLLVDRGFIPLDTASRLARTKYQLEPRTEFIGLIKQSVLPKALGPKDSPAGGVNPWVDTWLRVDVSHMAKQLSYQVLPVYLEVMPETDPEKVKSKMIASDAGREELFILPLRVKTMAESSTNSAINYPVPMFSTVIPAGRHLGYVFEWALMAIATMLICTALQLRPKGRRLQRKSTTLAKLQQSA